MNTVKLSEPIHSGRGSESAGSEHCASPVPQDIFTDCLSPSCHAASSWSCSPGITEDTEAQGGAVAFPRSCGHCPDLHPVWPSEHAPSLGEEAGPRQSFEGGLVAPGLKPRCTCVSLNLI
ncbi:unnamed protein product [Gulo gulo]|uniref:Uncharacterized protein n=1 Tax=Gulo gulo TaxID=48420 RepID=A0A9X9M229_GULGU|nr:unnamed protein product [Gulo gulo]